MEATLGSPEDGWCHVRIVSSENELLILVSPDDEEVGSLAKSACHDGGGVLHRALSLFVFNAGGEKLLQIRHAISACGRAAG